MGPWAQLGLEPVSETENQLHGPKQTGLTGGEGMTLAIAVLPVPVVSADWQGMAGR